MASMIHVLEQDEKDLSSNGLGVIPITTGTITEKAGGEYELQITAPILDDDRWTRLQVGRLLRANVPAQTTPQLSIYHKDQTTVTLNYYRFHLPGHEFNRTVHREPSHESPILERMVDGQGVTVEEEQADGWKHVITDWGNRGWTNTNGLHFLRTISSTKVGKNWEEVIPERPIKMQLFRIYSVEEAEDGTEVQVNARHISYDLLYNPILDYKTTKKTSVKTVLQGIMDHLSDKTTPFQLYTDVTKKVDGADYSFRNPLEVIMNGDDSLIAQADAQYIRDNYDLYIAKGSGENRGITISYGKNLTGVSVTTDESGVYTRILPVGEKADGTPLYLSGGKYVNSSRISLYPFNRTKVEKISGVKVGKKDENDQPYTETTARNALRERAEELLESGIDMPSIEMTVSFVDLGATDEYTAYRDLMVVHLYDTVRIVHPERFIDATATVIGYKYNIITEMFDSIDISNHNATGSAFLISGSAISNGSIRVGKLGVDSVTTSNITDVAITGAKIQNAQIEAAHIQDAAITHAKIAEAAITTANIADASITHAKIAEAAIDTANIEDAAITNAKIAEAAINTAQIQDAAITHAKIASAAIDTANIEDAAITNAKIAEAAITHAKIASAAIDTANIVDAAITGAKIGTAEITDAHIASLSATKLTAGRIDAGLIDVVNLRADNITAGTLNGERIGDGTVAYEKMDDDFVSFMQDLQESGESTSATVSNHGKSLEALVERIEDSEKAMTAFSQTSDAFELTVSQFKEDVKDELNSLREDVDRHFTFDVDGLTIQKTGSPFATVIDETSMKFQENKETVAQISGQQLEITKARVTDSIQIGSFAFVSTESGMGLVWRGT